MLKIILLMFCIIVTGCRTKYDTSKAIDILSSSSENQVDYKLQEVPLTLDDDRNLIKTDGMPSEYTSIAFDERESVYIDNILYVVGNRYLGVVQIDNKETNDVKHDIVNPYLAATRGFALVYNEKSFAIFDADTLEVLWKDNITSDGLASRFVCIENEAACFALSINGEIIKLSLSERLVYVTQVLAKQDIMLNTLYTPAIFQDYIIFASGNSEFAIFDTKQDKIVINASFVDSDNSSIFDINLVKEIYSHKNNVIISHINGLYMFNILYGRPLWTKKIVTLGNIGFFGQYMVLYDKGTNNLMMMYAETGDVKWIVKDQMNPMAIFVDYNKNIVICTDDGIHLFNSETGAWENKVLKFGLQNVRYVFVHNNNLYWVKGKKIYILK